MKSIRNLRSFIQNPVAFLDEGARTGVYTTVPICHRSFHLVFCPSLAEEILVKRSLEFPQNRRIFDLIRPVTGERGLVQLQGERSRAARRITRPLFSPSNLSKMGLDVASIAEGAFSSLEAESNFEVSNFMNELVLRTAFKLLLGIDVQHGSSARDFLKLNELCGKRMRSIFPFGNREVKRIKERLRDQVSRDLNERRSGGLSVPDLFSDDPDLLDHCLTFLFAGHETTASSITFSLLLLARYPELQERIANGDRELALRCYRESLRMFPPAYMLVRETASDLILGGKKLRKGEGVIIGLRQIHSNPRNFPDPARFDPDRPLPESRAFFPFGLGPKNCVGEGLAYLEASIILEAFCRNFSFTRNSEEIGFEALITLHPKEGQKLCLKRR